MSPRRKPVAAGDLVEVRLKAGQLSYVQQLGDSYIRNVPLTRALPGLFDSSLAGSDIQALSRGPSQFVVQFPLHHLVDQRMATVVGADEIPLELNRPPAVRVFVKTSSENPEGWSVTVFDETDPKGFRVQSGSEYQVEHPDVHQRTLPVWTIPGIGTFMRMLETQWTHESAVDMRLGIWRGDEANDKVPEGPRTRYFCEFPSRRDAINARAELIARGFTALVSHSESKNEWTVIAMTEERPTPALDREIDALAALHKGRCDGNETGPL
jgi:hypothetical protein